MKLLYEAANALEAHMILNLLEQAGISGRINGELLQGGVGDLPMAGFVRLMVDEKDYPQARKIVQEWENKPVNTANYQTPKNKSPAGSFLLGLVIGTVAMAVYFQTPITHSGIDYNGDGNFDEHWTYVNHRITKAEIDRNRDGQIDQVFMYDHKGLLKSSLSDNNFDGIFETKARYLDGNILWQVADTNGDGEQDLRQEFEHGLLKRAIFRDPATQHKVVKIQHFDDFKLIRAEVDTDKDGVLDTVYEYDANEEVIKTFSLDYRIE